MQKSQKNSSMLFSHTIALKVPAKVQLAKSLPSLLERLSINIHFAGTRRKTYCIP